MGKVLKINRGNTSGNPSLFKERDLARSSFFPSASELYRHKILNSFFIVANCDSFVNINHVFVIFLCHKTKMITLRELLAKMQNPKFIMSKDKEMGWLRDSEKKIWENFSQTTSQIQIPMRMKILVQKNVKTGR